MYNDIGKNIWYSSLSTILPGILTFLFWFITAKIAGPETVGLASAISSFVLVVFTISGLNISIGMKRFLGIAIASNDLSRFKQIFLAASIFTFIGSIVSIVLISIPQLQILDGIKIEFKYDWIIALMILAVGLNAVFSESLVSSRRSKILILPLLIGSIVRFPIFLVSFYVFNATEIGVIIAYASSFFVSTASYSIYFIRQFTSVSTKKTESLTITIKHLFYPSLVGWIPQLISVLGSQIGILAVFAIKGASEGGKFYIPITIFLTMLFIAGGINRVTHPVVAGIDEKEQQNRFVRYTLKIAFMFTMPIIMPLMFFAGNFLGLLGNEYSSASSTLIIIMIGTPFAIINSQVYYFAYGIGENRNVLYLGLIGNLTSFILYLLLVSSLGGVGAALAFSIGSLVQLIVSLRLASKYLLQLQYKTYSILTIVPILIGFALWKLPLNFLILSAVLILVSLVVYIKLHLFTDEDLRNIIYSGLSQNGAKKVYPILRKIMNKIS